MAHAGLPGEQGAALGRSERLRRLDESPTERVEESLIVGHDPAVLDVSASLELLCGGQVFQNARLDLLTHSSHRGCGSLQPQPTKAGLRGLDLVRRRHFHNVEHSILAGRRASTRNLGTSHPPRIGLVGERAVGNDDHPWGTGRRRRR